MKKNARELVSAVLIKEIIPLRVEYWQIPEIMDPLEAAELIFELPAVEYAEPNFFMALRRFLMTPILIVCGI